jgi:hypothetical protein
MAETRNECIILVGEPPGTPIRWENNIEIELQGMDCENRA